MVLPFNMDWMNWLADHRLAWLTPAMEAMSLMGEIQGYILIGTLIYVMFDKSLAVRLIVLVTMTMMVNHVLKILIRNPRPFVTEGTYLEKWAVSQGYARDLAMEYSTPSGHAMAGAAFYSYLFALVRHPVVRVLAVVAIIATGASRPYLGVHYVEDILSGWAIGIILALIAMRCAEPFSVWWNGRSYSLRIALAVIGSFALWGATLAISGWQIDAQPRAFVGYAGTITGIVIARPLELDYVGFDPRSSSIFVKIARYVFSVAVAFATLNALGKYFGTLAPDYSLAGYVLTYVRHIAVTFATLFIAPWVFTRIGLAKTA